MLFGAMNSPARPVCDELESIHRAGFDYFELAMDPPFARPRDIGGQIGELRRSLAAKKMKVVCHLPTFVYTADLTESIRRASLAEVFDGLRIAESLGARKVVLHPGYQGGAGSFDPAAARTHALESLAAVLSEARRARLTVCLENMFPRYRGFVEPEEFADPFHRFAELRMTLDVGHAHIGARGSQRILAFIDRFADRIEHLHISDNFGSNDDHLPVGTAGIDFRRVIGALRGIGYNESLTLEVFTPDREYLAISRRKITALLDESGRSCGKDPTVCPDDAPETEGRSDEG